MPTSKHWQPPLQERLRHAARGYPLRWWVAERHLLRPRLDAKLAHKWYGIKSTASGACGMAAAVCAAIYYKLTTSHMPFGPVLFTYAVAAVVGWVLPDVRLHLEIRPVRGRLRASLRTILPELLDTTATDDELEAAITRLFRKLPAADRATAERFLAATSSPGEGLRALGHVTGLRDLYWWAQRQGWRSGG